MPDANTAVIIGGNNYSSSVTRFRPIIQENYSVRMFSLEITSAGATIGPVELILRNANLAVTVTNNITTIGTGTLLNQGSILVVGGNFVNDGAYGESLYNNLPPTIEFTGSGKTVGGTSTNTFNAATISGSIILKSNITVNALGSSKFEVTGTLDPELNRVTFPTSYAGFTVSVSGTLKVKASIFTNNYSLFPTMYGSETQASTVEYASNGNQTIANNGPYGILRITGSGVRSLAGNTTVSAKFAITQLVVEAGTLDLQGFSLVRVSDPTVAGGTLTLANGATLMIGGTGTFPTGFATRNLGSTSTVNYYGSTQTVANEAYGNLTLSGSGSKTLPAATMAVAGKFTSAGSASFTARGAINVSGDVELGGASNFNGAAFTHTVGGNWTNNATFAGASSTVVLNGANKQINRTVNGSATFNNLTVTNAGLTIPASAVTIAGNLLTTGAGALTQSNGTLTMTGNSTSITGTGISLNNLTVTGTINTTASFTVTGNLVVSAGGLTATTGTVLMNGASKNISSSGALTFFGLRVLGSISTSSSFTINSDLSGIGKLTATAGTVTFNGTSTFAGPHDLFNVTVASGKSLTMVANANLSIAGELTTTGTFNTTTNSPNTVTFNGTASQNVPGRAYSNLVLTAAGAKTASGALLVNGNFTINSGSNLNAGVFSHTINGNWINNGTFAHQNGTVVMAGPTNTTLTGATTFNALTINKSNEGSTVTQTTDMTTATLNMTKGLLLTGAFKVNISGNRTGLGWIIGTVRRNHTFAANTAYAFNGPYTQIKFGTATNVSDVSTTLTLGAVNNFPFGASINGKLTVAIPVGTYTGATLQLQYQESELNANAEDELQLYKFSATTNTWESQGKNQNNATENWVNQTGLSNITGQWTLSSTTSVYSWKGTTSTDWNLAANWNNITSGAPIQATSVPGATDIVELGNVVPTYQPIVNLNTTIKGLQFKGLAPTSLTLGTGNLTVSGNLATSGTGTIANHAINVDTKLLTVGGDMVLSDGGNNISLNLVSGTATVAGNLNHAGNAIINLGTGNFNLSGDYNISTPVNNFRKDNGTFTYQGGNTQKIGEVYYHHLTIDKTEQSLAELTAASIGYVAGTLTIKKEFCLYRAAPIHCRVTLCRRAVRLA